VRQASERLEELRVEKALQDVLARPEFQPRSDSEPPLARLLEELFASGPAIGVVGEIAYWLMIVCGVLLVAWLGLLLWLHLPARRRSSATVEGVELSPAERARELARDAAIARDAGDLRLASRLYAFALVVGLGARGDLEYDDAWTNRELVERGEPTPELRAWLAPLVGELDRLLFGAGTPADADVERLARLVHEHVGGRA